MEIMLEKLSVLDFFSMLYIIIQTLQRMNST